MSSSKSELSPWPKGLSQPAISALEYAGYKQLEELTTVTERDILNLHGMGPKGIRILREALQTRGWDFAPAKPTNRAQKS